MLVTPEHSAEAIEIRTLQNKTAAGVCEHAGEFAPGVGAMHGYRAVVARYAAAIDDAIQLRQAIVDWIAFKVIDDDGDARHALRLGKKTRYLRRLQMVNKEAAGNDIDACVSEWERESVSRQHTRRGPCRWPGSRVRQVSGAAVEQGDVWNDVRSDIWREVKPRERCLQHVGAPAGDLQNVRRPVPRHACECPLEQAGMQAHSTEAPIGESDVVKRCVDLRRCAAVVVEPLVVHNSFHDLLDLLDDVDDVKPLVVRNSP